MIPLERMAALLAVLLVGACGPNRSCSSNTRVDLPDTTRPDTTLDTAPDTVEDSTEPEPPPSPDLGEAPDIPPIEEPDEEPTATDEEWRYITDHDHAEKVLAESNVAWGRSKPKIKSMMRIGEEARAIRFKLLLDPEEGENIWTQYKVRQTDYYHEWKREILAYEVGKRIHAPVVPVVDRKLPEQAFRKFLDEVEETDYEIIRWQGGSSRGSLRYWVEALRPRTIGDRVCDEEYMTQIATALHPANAEALASDGYTVYREMGRAMVFDYLILNDDRARNMGTTLAPDGVRHLVLIDNGLAFGYQTRERVKAKGYFDAMSYFPRDTIDALRAMTREETLALLTPPDDRVLSIRGKAAAQLWKRRNRIIARVDELFEKYGDHVYY